MEIIVSKIDTSSSDFVERKKVFEELMMEWRSHQKRTTDRNQDPAMIKHLERGKLPVRRRVALLTDPGTPFLELSNLAAFGQYDDSFPSAGIITGIGVIHG